MYAYECEGGVWFYTAGNMGLDRLCNTFNEAYQYAKMLRDAHGLNVPDHAIEALKADAIAEAERINGPRSAVAEVLAENAKLRELLGDALKTLFHKRFDGSVGCTRNCPRWQFGKDCQLVDGCWLELEAAKLGVEVEV